MAQWYDQALIPNGLAAVGNTKRIAAFDALRGAMMALGIVFHAAVPYCTPDGPWGTDDAANSRIFDILTIFLHTFRLPVFFLLAGFFGSLLMDRYGWRGMFRDRALRLGFPLAVAILFIQIPLIILKKLAHLVYTREDFWPRFVDWMSTYGWLNKLDMGHLWFLKTLLWLTLLAVLFRGPLSRLQGAWFVRLISTRTGLACLILVSSATYLTSPMGFISTPLQFQVDWRVLVCYAFFYAVGWGAYLNRSSLRGMTRFGGREIALAAMLTLPAWMSYSAQLAAQPAQNTAAYLASVALSAAMAWLGVFGLMGLFLRRFESPDPGWRYLSDSSYWMYLAHPLVLLFVQVPLRYLHVHALVKFSISLTLTLIILLWAYDRFVRESPIGEVLNGRRMPRWARFAGRADEREPLTAEPVRWTSRGGTWLHPRAGSG